MQLDIAMEYDETTDNLLVICKEADLAYAICSASTPREIGVAFNALKDASAQKLSENVT